MNSKGFIISIVISICFCIAIITIKDTNTPKSENPIKTQNNNHSSTSNKVQSAKDIPMYKDLNSLKNNSDLIAIVEGTNNQEKRDYKGISSIVTTVKVKEVFKGDKNLTEVKVIQVDGVDVPPENGQNLLMFLTKGDGIDNPDCYGVVGAGQGIYEIGNNSSPENFILKPQAIENKKVLEELSCSYEDLKNKLN